MRSAHSKHNLRTVLLAGMTATLAACSGNQPVPHADAGCPSACTAPANGTAKCSDGACFTTCNSPYTLCGTDCVDTQTSATDCGTCGNACSAGAACTGGTCGGACASATSCAVASTCLDNCGTANPTLCAGMQCSTGTPCQDTCGQADDSCTTGCASGACSNGACTTGVCTTTGCSATTPCQDNCGNTNNSCATACGTGTPGFDNCGQPSTSCGSADGGPCTPAGCNAFVACEDTCGGVDNSCPTACTTTNPGMDNCGQQNSRCTGVTNVASDGGTACTSLQCNPLVACQDNCGNPNTACFTGCDTAMPGYDNCGVLNSTCGTYAMGWHVSDPQRQHQTVLVPIGGTGTKAFVWHDAPGLAAPADLTVEMAGHVIMQVSSESARPFARAGMDVAMLEADVPYVLELDRHDHAVTIKIRREGGNVILFQSEATVADAATAADLILAESFRRIAVTLE